MQENAKKVTREHAKNCAHQAAHQFDEPDKMTVGRLKELLSNYNDDTLVVRAHGVGYEDIFNVLIGKISVTGTEEEISAICLE